MKGFKDLFGSMFKRSGKKGDAEPNRENASPDKQRQDIDTERSSGAAYEKGDLIGGRYEVHRVLGIGGFGIVYQVYSHQTGDVYALKTFRDEYLKDEDTRERFRREASVWVDLERHPYLVRAYFVDEISGRLYIAMEYIAPDQEGLNTLEGYLKHQPPDLAQSLRWSIQTCHGMEYAYSRGVRSHRDIKPLNIMISLDKTVKITDLGLVGVLKASKMSGVKLSFQRGRVGLSTMGGVGFGTPTHMPPEQFTNARDCDERSDIYSFGVVLYQMATGGKLPFLASPPRDGSPEERIRFQREMHRLHREAPVPKLDSPLHSIIQRCLQKEPGRRYQTFQELRGELEVLLEHETGEVIKLSEPMEFESWEWNNKGASLANLGRFDEAITCYEEAIEINPRYAAAWTNKGSSLFSLGRFDEAIKCFEKAIDINPQFAGAWINKGTSLAKLSRFDETITCCEKAIDINPRLSEAWTTKGNSLHGLGRFDETITCYDEAIDIDPQCLEAWNNKGVSLHNLGRFDEAITCHEEAIKINPQDSAAWINKGSSLAKLGRSEEAISSYEKAIDINPRSVEAWLNKALAEDEMGNKSDAISSFKKFIEIAPAHYAQQIEHARQRLYELEEKSNEDVKRLREKWDLNGHELNIDIELVTELLSHNLKIREKALIHARDLAKMGDHTGTIALEAAIRIKSNLPNCEFYEPRFGMFSGEVLMNAEEEIYRLARNNKLLENPKKSQALISKTFLLGRAVDVTWKVRAIGEEQLHDFQLLGTHLQCRSEQIMRSRR